MFYQIEKCFCKVAKTRLQQSNISKKGDWDPLVPLPEQHYLKQQISQALNVLIQSGLFKG